MIEHETRRSLHRFYPGTCGKLHARSHVPMKRRATAEEAAAFTLALASHDFP
jgi:hypothetical protein